MNPDETAPKGEQSGLGSYCLQTRLPKYISRGESRRQLLWLVGKGYLYPAEQLVVSKILVILPLYLASGVLC